MREPKPELLAPPKKEPRLKIGVVLEDDRKTSLTVRPLEHGYVLQLGDQREALICNQSYNLSKPLTIQAPPQQVLTPQAGLEVEAVVVGRSFHWRKEINQILPGNFEIQYEAGSLVLINEVSFEEYLACVISSEMANDCPPDFAKAQAVAARSWSIAFLSNKHAGAPYQICNDDDCQRYQGTTFLSASSLVSARACRGEFLVTAQHSVCPAYYSKSCGGTTELAEHSFGFSVPGISSVRDYGQVNHTEHTFCSPEVVPEGDLKSYLGAVDVSGNYFNWNHTVSHNDLVTLLRERLGRDDLTEVTSIKVKKRGVSGRATLVEIQGVGRDGMPTRVAIEGQYEIRRCLHPKFMLSSAFTVSDEHSSDTAKSFSFSGSGWGHGVGMCQIGAVGMALKGYSYREILKHYFPLCSLVKAYE